MQSPHRDGGAPARVGLSWRRDSEAPLERTRDVPAAPSLPLDDAADTECCPASAGTGAVIVQSADGAGDS